MKFEYSKTEDALYIYFKEVEVSRSEDVDEGIIIDYDAMDDVVGIEVLDESSRIDVRDSRAAAALARDTLTLALSRKGRGDLSLALRAWLRVAVLIATVWIPAFAGMTGERVGTKRTDSENNSQKSATTAR